VGRQTAAAIWELVLATYLVGITGTDCWENCAFPIALVPPTRLSYATYRRIKRCDHLKGAMNNKLFYSCLIGCAIGFAPLLYFASFQARHPIEIGEVTRHILSFSALPGALVAMVFSGGIVHGANLWIICVVDAALYSWLMYLLLSLWEKRKARSRRDDGAHAIRSDPRS
jgi:hypothetical protein